MPAERAPKIDPGLIPIEELLLQREDMLLLDALLDHGPEHVEARANLAENHPLADNSRGIPAWVGIELMAQAISVFSALGLRSRNLPPRIGLLLGARTYEAYVPFFRAGVDLTVRVTLSLGDAAGLAAFDCTIHEGDELLARAKVKGYMPDNIDGFLEAGGYD